MHATLENKVKFLSVVGVEREWRFGSRRFDRENERVGFAVGEYGSSRWTLICFCTLYGGIFVLACKEIRVHSRFVSEHQCRQFYAVVLGYLVQKTDRNVFFARLVT